MAREGERTVSSIHPSPYVSLALAAAPRLLNLLDRDAVSSSRGSFDRDHWAWKFRDFPMGMLQAGVYPVALLWKHDFPESPYHRNPRLAEWVELAVDATLRRQHANGSFDAFAPNEQDVGPTLGIMHAVAEAVRLMDDGLTPALVNRVREALHRACRFALSRDEAHAFVSNHYALFAVAFLDAHEMLGDRRYLQRAEDLVARVISEQSPEGWYREYEGADPGYESLGIFHLAAYWRRTRSDRVLESLRRSIEFYAHFVHPDGSVGGAYGSRQTPMYFPGGFEILAGRVPAAAAVAAFMRRRLPFGNVPTPITADVHNLIPLTYTYLEAALASEPRPSQAMLPLPCQSLCGIRRFHEAGLAVAGSAAYYAVTSVAKGGVLRAFDKTSERVLYEDAGYWLHASRRHWSSQFNGLGSPARGQAETEVATQTVFAEVNQRGVTPAAFLLLRALNLTVCRSVTIGRWIRRAIVKRLILRKRLAPVSLRRTIAFLPEQIRVTDVIEARRRLRVGDARLLRSFTAFHMGSAKYFQASELYPVPAPDVRHVARDLERLGSARVEFLVTRNVVTVSAGQPHEMAAGQIGRSL